MDAPTPRIDVRDPQQCLELLAALPLTKPALVQDMLAGLLATLAQAPLEPAAYLNTLEMARPALAFVQDEMAARYAGRPTAPGTPEEQALRRVVDLWQAMARAYAQVAQLGGHDAGVQSHIALICHRCIHYSGNAIVEYLRARRELPRGLWSTLHGYYASAEEWDIADNNVAEPLDDTYKLQSCAQAYAAVLLTDLGNPYGRGARELGWLVSWSQRFARKLRIGSVPGQAPGTTHVVDLDGDAGACPLERATGRGAGLRAMVASELSAEMHLVAVQLKQRTPPAQLGLGADIAPGQAGRLLMQLYRPWCLTSGPRRFQRRMAHGTAQLVCGIEAIHYYISGEEFKQPAHVRVYSREEVDSIVTFRYQVDPTQQLHVRATQMGYTVERWEVGNESVAGFRLERAVPGARLEHGQLLAIQPPDGERFLLCAVSWLMYRADGTLAMGITVLPGAAQGVAIRQTGANMSASERYARGFLLPGIAAFKEEASVVLPRGWFAPERIIEICTDRRMEVQLTQSMQIGADFERARFTLLRTIDAS